MPLYANYYTPVDVAIHWGHFTAYRTEILQTAYEHPEKLLYYSPRWPLFHVYLERLCDAIDCHELPAWYLGQPLAFPARQNPGHVQLRRSDLQFWGQTRSADDRPDFLFQSAHDHSHCVTLGAHLAQQAELNASNQENAKLREENCRLQAQLDASDQKCAAVTAQLKKERVPTEQSLSGCLLIIAAILKVVLGKSDDGQWQSIYKTQTDLVDAITDLYPLVGGLKKHTIDRRFSDAWRCLAQLT